MQQERVDNREKIAVLQSAYKGKIEDLLEQLHNHKEMREAEQKERLQMLEVHTPSLSWLLTNDGAGAGEWDGFTWEGEWSNKATT
jgi:hypothetical protein